MATGALIRKFIGSARIIPAQFRSLCVRQQTLQFNPLLSLAIRAASTTAAKKTTTKTPIAASKPGPKTKTTGGTTATKKPGPGKTAATKKAAAKKKPVAKKTVAKKPAAKKVPQKKELTDEQKEKKQIRELRARALKPPSRGHHSGYITWFTEQASGRPVNQAGGEWSSLPQETKDKYIEKAKDSAPVARKALEEWVLSQPVEAIREANNARRHLRRLGVKHDITPFTDPRQPKRPAPPIFLFMQEQYRSGREFPKDENGKSSIVNNMKILREEYQNLGASEVKKYEDMARQERERYAAQKKQVK